MLKINNITNCPFCDKELNCDFISFLQEEKCYYCLDHRSVIDFSIYAKCSLIYINDDTIIEIYENYFSIFNASFGPHEKVKIDHNLDLNDKDSYLSIVKKAKTYLILQ